MSLQRKLKRNIRELLGTDVEDVADIKVPVLEKAPLAKIFLGEETVLD